MKEKIWYDKVLNQLFVTSYEVDLLCLDLPDGVHVTFDFKNGAINKVEEIFAFFENAVHVGDL